MTEAPLRIAELPAGTGLIGISIAPGKQQATGMTGPHHRDLAVDLDRVAAWGAALVVTLLEEAELVSLGIARLGAEVQRRAMAWAHWPIVDYGVPDAAFDAEWPARSAGLRQRLDAGGRILIHCRGGLGRSGMVAARLLADSGRTPDAAITAVRTARPGAIETAAQAHWVGLP